MRPVGPGSLDPEELLAVLGEIYADLAELQVPTKPVQMPPVLFADLPVADDWRGCVAFVTDKDSIAVSTDVAGTYAWLRADGSAL